MVNKPEDLLRGYVQVSSLPIVYTKINARVNDPRSSLKDLSDIISDDPGLTSRLLQLVNSAFYGYPTKIDTISRALLIVGTQQLRDLALATSIMRLFEGISPELVTMESFWKHSIACGVAAKIIATYRREPNVERFFVAGIVHDIGRLIIFKKAPEEAHSALRFCQTNAELLYPVERRMIGVDHCEVGHVLLQSWNLPVILDEVVSYHHTPRMASLHPIETAIVHVADILSHSLQFGTSGESFIPPLDPKAWELLEIPISSLSPILDQLERDIADVLQTIIGAKA
jgi:HD-like signal output (HDOD) protein